MDDGGSLGKGLWENLTISPRRNNAPDTFFIIFLFFTFYVRRMEASMFDASASFPDDVQPERES